MSGVLKNIDQYSDEDLLGKLESHSTTEIVGCLFLRYKYLIYGLCLKYYKNQHDAEDVTMEIYEKLVKTIRKHKVENFKSWLYTLTKNHCFEKLRSIKTKSPKNVEAALMYSEGIFHLDNKEVKEIEFKKLNDCIAKLKSLQAKCVELFYFKKKSYDEISQELDMEWSKIRSNIQNARRNLKICIEN